MKGISRWAALGAALLLSACSKPVLHWRNAEVSNGKIYEVGANKPFDGVVTDVPHEKLSRRLGTNVLWNIRTNQPTGLASLLGGLDFACDVTVEEGLVTDHVLCRHPQSQVVAYEGSLTEGGLDGEIAFHASNGGRVAVLPMKDGRVEGRARVYYGDNPEQLSLEADMANSRYNGELVGYYPSGKTKAKGRNLNSAPDGVWEVYREEDGTVSERVTYEAGKITSRHLYEADGKEYLSEQQMWDLHRVIASDDNFVLTPEQDALLTDAEARYGAVRLLTPSQRAAKIEAEAAGRAPEVAMTAMGADEAAAAAAAAASATADEAMHR